MQHSSRIGSLQAGRRSACVPSTPAPPPTRISRCNAVYQPPSSATAASELELLKQSSVVVPDSNESLAAAATPGGKQLFGARAATVSAATIAGIVAAGALGLKPYQNAITAAMTYDRCKALPTEAERGHCKLDKATVNVGTLFSKEVEGRVCTQVDPSQHSNTDAMVARVQSLVAMYKENGVVLDKLIFRLPATWAGIQAAKQLESKGIATQLSLVFCMTQAVAGAQAGTSVLQLSVARVREWYLKFPNAVRDPRGPRQDAGFPSTTDPGVALVQQVFNYVKKYHPATKILVTGLRNRDDVMACSGADFLLVPTKVLTELALTPTSAGYNDGLRAAATADDAEGPALSPNAAEKSGVQQVSPVTEGVFNDGLDMMATDLLKQGLKQQVADAERLLPVLEKGTLSSSF